MTSAYPELTSLNFVLSPYILSRFPFVYYYYPKDSFEVDFFMLNNGFFLILLEYVKMIINFANRIGLSYF